MKAIGNQADGDVCVVVESIDQVLTKWREYLFQAGFTSG